MKRIETQGNNQEFQVLAGNSQSQSAIMVLRPGDSEGGPDNKHDESDQWLFVISGRGEATINGTRKELTEGTLVLIEAGETHEIRNTGNTPLRTLNFYVPPEY
jgi:mannose-6-phosphate isomerase-like protein (cupin superfamily)